MIIKFYLIFFLLALPLFVLAKTEIKFSESSASDQEIKNLKEENKNLKKDIQNQTTITKIELENRRLALVKECNQNSLDECIELAETYFKENNFNKGIDILKEKCEGKLINACLLVANKYIAKKDTSNSIKYLGKACDNSDYESCNQLGILQFRSKKIKDAIETLTKNCANNFYQSCFNNLLIKEGQSSYPQNLNQFWELCLSKKSNESCNKVQDLAKLGSQKCFAKNVSFCLELGTFEFTRSEYEKAQKVYNFACELGDSLACYNLGQSLWYAKGVESALNAWKRACDLKDEYSCGYFYALKNSGDEFKKVINLFEGNCEKLDMNSCFQTASIYAMKKDKVNAIKFLKKSVEYGLAASTLFENLKEFEFLTGDADFKFIIKTLNNH